MKTIVLAVAVMTALMGCSSDSEKEPEARDSSPSAPPSETTLGESATPPQETEVAPEPEPKEETSDWNLPKGFPKVVPVSSLPYQVRSWYEMSDAKRAVAIAPGVWAELAPGAEMEDAVLSGVYDGFCSSKAAFERKWLDGEETAGTCW